MKSLNLIVAVDEHGGFGKDGKIPWYFPEDLKHFKEVTANSTCIMGRKTYTDMFDMRVARNKKKYEDGEKPVKFDEILPNRESFVISSTLTKVEGATVVKNIREAVEKARRPYIFVIGGYRVYVEALPWVGNIHMTVVSGNYDCDRLFPVSYVKKNFAIVKGERINDDLKFVLYKRVRK